MNNDFTTFPYLETERLLLRPLTLKDAPAIYELRSDPDIARLTGRVPAKHIDEAVAFINKIKNLIADNASIYWAISYKENDDLIGTACFWNFDFDSSSIEIGYELLPKHQHKGIMNEAIKALIKFAFEKIMAKTITAFPSGNNPASVRVLEKVGFQLTSGSYDNNHQQVEELLTYTLSNEGGKLLSS